MCFCTHVEEDSGSFIDLRLLHLQEQQQINLRLKKGCINRKSKAKRMLNQSHHQWKLRFGREYI